MSHFLDVESKHPSDGDDLEAPTQDDGRDLEGFVVPDSDCDTAPSPNLPGPRVKRLKTKKRKRQPTGRNFHFTLNNFTEKELHVLKVNSHWFKYVCWQEEKAPTTGFS